MLPETQLSELDGGGYDALIKVGFPASRILNRPFILCPRVFTARALPHSWIRDVWEEGLPSVMLGEGLRSGRQE